MYRKYSLLPLMLLALLAAVMPCAAAETSPDDAWKALPGYQPGQDLAPLLALDRAVIEAMATPPARSACAARLAALLESPDTTLAARQYICLELRQIGTPQQVPVLARLLAKAETSEMARYALQAIPGEESLVVLREALGTLRGPALVGVINSLGARRDARAVARLQELADAADRAVASAAVSALGSIGGDEAAALLLARAEKAGRAPPPELLVALLRCAAVLPPDRAKAIYTRLEQPGQPLGIRRAAVEGLLGMQGPAPQATILAWFTGDDPLRRQVAAGHLAALSDQQLDELAAKLDRLPEGTHYVLLEVLTPRKGKAVMPLVMSAVQSDKPELRAAGLRCLGVLGEGATIPVLIDALASGDAITAAAQQSLGSLPRKEVGTALLDALQHRAEIRPAVIEVLKRMRYYEAIDPLAAIAVQDDPAVYGPALEGLRGIADPDKTDLSRLVALLLKTEPGRHRDEVERTILIVCEKVPAGQDRSAEVLNVLSKINRSEAPKYLPLLGRLGGDKALQTIEAAVKSTDADTQQAAVRALCNWPDATVADRLWELASRSENDSYRRWALRAYVRVITLKSDRPEAETLALLQKAFQAATATEDKQLVLSRMSTVRTMGAVVWLAGFLDDPNLAQAACGSLVELAHHRFLRHPNMDRFGPILDKVAKISTDPETAALAKKYRLGL